MSPTTTGARLAFAVEAMRELSTRADPGAMTRAYAARMRRVLPTDRLVLNTSAQRRRAVVRGR